MMLILNPRFPADAISITRAEFDAACEQLAAENVPLKADREQAGATSAAGV